MLLVGTSPPGAGGSRPGGSAPRSTLSSGALTEPPTTSSAHPPCSGASPMVSFAGGFSWRPQSMWGHHCQEGQPLCPMPAWPLGQPHAAPWGSA